MEYKILLQENIHNRINITTNPKTTREEIPLQQTSQSQKNTSATNYRVYSVATNHSHNRIPLQQTSVTATNQSQHNIMQQITVTTENHCNKQSQ